MKPLNRPMFRYGGPIKEGVMSGIREPKKGGGSMGTRKAALVGHPVYPKDSSGREHHVYNFLLQGLYHGGRMALPHVMRALGYGMRTGVGGKRAASMSAPISKWWGKDPIVGGARKLFEGATSPAAKGKWATAGRFLKSPSTVLGGAYALDAFPGGQPLLNLDMLGNRNILGQKYDPKTDKRIKGTGISALWEDDEVKIDDSDKTTETNPWKDKYEALLKANETPPKSDEQIRNERIQKYRDIMDIKGMNKRAAYDSLIDASKLVGESGDFKEDIKSGKLINQIIQATSKAYDKPAKTKDAIDTLILKGEIEKDIKSSLPTEAEKTAAAFGISKEDYRKKLLGELSPAQNIAALSAKATGGKPNSVTVSAGYKSSGIVPKATITDTIVDEWIDDKDGRTEIDFVKEVISKEEDFVPGLYVVGDRAILFDGTNYSYDY